MRRYAKQSMAQFSSELMQSFSMLATKQRGIALWDDPTWRSCLLENNWVGASWPVSWGGPGWTSEQKFRWYRACHQSFEDYVEPPEIRDVGPCLQRWGNHRGRGLMAGITSLDVRWSLALFEGSFTPADLATKLDSSWRLSGWKTQVRFALRADRLLVVAKQGEKFVLLDIASDTPGIEIAPMVGLAGDVTLAQIQFSDVLVTEEQIAGELESSEALRQLCYQTVSLELGRSGAIERQLVATRQQVEAGIAASAEFSSRLAELEIALQALVIMEKRVVAASATDVPSPIPWSLLQAQGLALQLEVGELVLDTFGYYALPYPDEISLHNEGPIGPSSGMTASRSMLRATEQVNYANLAGDMYDIAAEELLSGADPVGMHEKIATE